MSQVGSAPAASAAGILDVLDGMKSLKVCIAYEYHGKRTEYAGLNAARGTSPDAGPDEEF